MQDDTTILKKINRRVIYIIILIVLVISGVSFMIIKPYLHAPSSQTQDGLTEYSVAFNDALNLHVFVADTDQERSQGLSVFESLQEHQAMLFMFDTPGLYPFWMKDMKFPIDMIWVDQYGKIVYIYQNAQPADFPDVYQPQTKAQYVIEFVAGFSDTHGLSIGSDVSHILVQP